MRLPYCKTGATLMHQSVCCRESADRCVDATAILQMGAQP